MSAATAALEIIAGLDVGHPETRLLAGFISASERTALQTLQHTQLSWQLRYNGWHTGRSRQVSGGCAIASVGVVKRCVRSESRYHFKPPNRILCNLWMTTFPQRLSSRPPIVNGGSPPKKRHMRSLPPFSLHLQYEPKSGSDAMPNCGATPD